MCLLILAKTVDVPLVLFSFTSMKGFVPFDNSGKIVDTPAIFLELKLTFLDVWWSGGENGENDVLAI